MDIAVERGFDGNKEAFSVKVTELATLIGGRPTPRQCHFGDKALGVNQKSSRPQPFHSKFHPTVQNAIQHCRQGTS